LLSNPKISQLAKSVDGVNPERKLRAAKAAIIYIPIADSKLVIPSIENSKKVKGLEEDK
jgi:hypothetical protein